MTEAYIGVHICRADGYYEGATYTPRRDQLITRTPHALFLASSQIGVAQAKYDLQHIALVIPTDEKTPTPLSGWESAFQNIIQCVPADQYIIWGAELLLATHGNHYQGCVGAVYDKFQSRNLPVTVSESDCFVIDIRRNWAAFFDRK